jgi:membrane-associated phospholipid phosphatase
MTVAMLVDRHIYLVYSDSRSGNNDWHRMFRTCGFLPTWLFVGAVLMLHQRHRTKATLRRHLGTRWPAGLILITNVISCGLMGELIKMIVRRERPNAHDGFYVFRPFTEKPFGTGGLGFPSSHAIIAFAAAWILCRLYPKTWPVWLILGIGCAVARVRSGSHFVSDVTASMIISYGITAVMWHKFYK